MFGNKKEKPDQKFFFNPNIYTYALEVIIIITINSKNFKPFIQISLISIKDVINAYYNYIDINQFDDIKCPCCKNKGYLKFHKYYERNLTYKENGEIINDKINIAVLECSFCKKNKNFQTYHALLPEFILPYHLYESSLIIKSIYDYIIGKIKLNEILENIKITHKLFYDWLKLIKEYLLSSSIILKTKNNLIDIINCIYKLNHKFLIDFYENYEHPYFLNKITCVPLCKTP